MGRIRCLTARTAGSTNAVVNHGAAPRPQWRRRRRGSSRGLEIPDLVHHPTPRDKAQVLLESGAEVEHALMVQYLYAAYSLKSPRRSKRCRQKAALNDGEEMTQISRKSWPVTLRGIAREEMGHLMTVQNLLVLLRLEPNFRA